MRIVIPGPQGLNVSKREGIGSAGRLWELCCYAARPNRTARCDMHRVHEAQALLDAAFAHQVLDGAGDIHESAAVGHFKPEVFGQGFHIVCLWPGCMRSAQVSKVQSLNSQGLTVHNLPPASVACRTLPQANCGKPRQTAVEVRKKLRPTSTKNLARQSAFSQIILP